MSSFNQAPANSFILDEVLNVLETFKYDLSDSEHESFLCTINLMQSFAVKSMKNDLPDHTQSLFKIYSKAFAKSFQSAVASQDQERIKEFFRTFSE